MRVLVVHAHPVETSFNRSLFHTVTETLATGGHQVDPLSLYDESFDALLSREERINYEDVPGNLTPAIQPYVDRLLAAEAIVFVHPVWNYGYPAVLKGYFDRIFLPGVSFALADGGLKPLLTNIRRAAFVTTYGGDRWRTFLMGDPPRRLARRWGWATFQTKTPPKYLALYDMNNNRQPQLTAFLEKVKAEFRRW
ncbi:MAG TPA: NAD(P)H-dependent oxidoreductase [Devosiaceae bacterium]|nr:NAD(P)H-dependent oxidoreductase [Devosiaceae bacterium]